ncbi:FKBP-type peptidyl-prolyl cis-trans isomerase [Cellulomonas shaoxiangyii]|uniref:peptidylprolyl isomerase n=1 Tax=Cellulomonas shaoxiangyii TaxID=2566013 RepID=A0A4P7SGT3_9CELL|nr:FKBP-type peptidyl-prolyl cis-trans isomerase [Cellulomonas shaoxiangyii]QCB92286.1 FKBP-type peptidyl-prolyl cis-trans isomerase [Cellulomonas shaoxiangyii]TGY85902.1 FKBP-type peptidyl-prolyl cis-trans isomerase [Cellulomonas shaoxiangyii]
MRRTTTARPAARRAAAAALALTLGVGLAACSGEASDDATTAAPTDTASAAPAQTASPEDVEALEGVTVEGDLGAKPTIGLPSTPFEVSAPVARLVDEGTGDEIAEGDLIDMNTVWVNGTDGAEVSTTYGATPEKLQVSPDMLPPALVELLVGGKVGLRFAFASPAEGGSTVAVAEVIGSVAPRAEGTEVAAVEGLPTVTRAEDGEPSIEAASGEAPAELVVQPLIQGDGPAVEAGQTVYVNYSGFLWDGTPFDSSWGRGQLFPVANIGQGQVIAGWNEGLVGQNVGSQVLLVVPPEKGYGEEGSGDTIPPNSTLVFVVDIVGVG